MALKVKANLPLLLFASILPDVDLLLPSLMQHRGPTHSVIIMTLVAIPFFVFYRKRVVPYYVALLSHSLIGDFVTGGAQLFWPLSNGTFGLTNVDVKSLLSSSVELTLFFVSILVMLKLGDLHSLFSPGTFNFTLIVPFIAVLVPLLQNARALELGLGYFLPPLLVVPSLFYTVVLAYAMLIDLRFRLKSGINLRDLKDSLRRVSASSETLLP